MGNKLCAENNDQQLLEIDYEEDTTALQEVREDELQPEITLHALQGGMLP